MGSFAIILWRGIYLQPVKQSGASKDEEWTFGGHPVGASPQAFNVFAARRLCYQRSRQRRRLARLDDRLLRDIGIDRIAAMGEISKPFWRG